MPKPDFPALKAQLIRSGFALTHIHRTIRELNDHFDDLVASGIRSGRVRQVAEQDAHSALGDLQGVLSAMHQHPELKSWAWRWPRLALVIYPLACLAALPAMPVLAGIHHASNLARWLMCFLLGGLITAAMFLVLQLSITFA